MKKSIILAVSIFALSFSLCAQSPVNDVDSTLHFTNPGKITILENDKGLYVINDEGETIFEESYRDTIIVKKKETFSGKDINFDNGGISVRLPHPTKKWSLVMEGLGFGLNDAMNQPSGAGLKWGKSFDITWLYALGVQYKHGISKVTFGIGFEWKNFKMTGEPYRMVKPSTGGLELGDYPEGVMPLNSTLKIFSLSFPLLYQVKMPYFGTTLSLGPILNFNTHSSLKTKYIDMNGNEVQEYVSHTGQRPVSLDLFGALTYSNVGIYVRYGTQKAMRDFSALNFTPLTIGLMFCL